MRALSSVVVGLWDAMLRPGPSVSGLRADFGRHNAESRSRVGRSEGGLAFNVDRSRSRHVLRASFSVSQVYGRNSVVSTSERVNVDERFDSTLSTPKRTNHVRLGSDISHNRPFGGAVRIRLSGRNGLRCRENLLLRLPGARSGLDADRAQAATVAFP